MTYLLAVYSVVRVEQLKELVNEIAVRCQAVLDADMSRYFAYKLCSNS